MGSSQNPSDQDPPWEPTSLQRARVNLEICKDQLNDPDTALAVVMHGVIIAVGDALVAQAEISLRILQQLQRGGDG